MIRQLIFGTAACVAITFSCSASAADIALNCPAIAAQTPEGYSGACNPPLTPLQDAICHYKPRVWTDSLLMLDNVVGVDYVRDLRAAGAGTPQCKALLEGHKAYEKELQGCGNNGDCVLKVMRHWAGTMHRIEDRLRPPLDEAALKKFAGGMKFQDGQQTVSLLQRLEQGMDLYPLPQATLPNGNVLVWGFQPHNAQVQSLAVVDRQGAVQLLGIVDGLYLALPSGKTRWEPGKDARIALFVRDPAALSQNLSAIHAWAAADVLGFNQDCPGKDQARCQAAAKLPLPIQAYNLNCKASNGKIIPQHCALPLPQVPEDVSPGLFWQ
ncbi:hypothetical protein LDB30_13355 [Acidithiobacillus ferrooxidans]|jgi:hypothetical protein|nr:hypothetical protein LDB30_13355 [Acidithiobacillus ferrooxidans]